MKTARDMIDDLGDYLGEAALGRMARGVKRAVSEGLRELANCHNWRYYYLHSRLVTSDTYETGTVAYDHTGGTYERELTLTTGTWPTWAAKGLVVIDSVAYQVAERISNSVVLLESYSNPGADVTAGETYQLVRQSIALPTDFKSLMGVVLAGTSGPLSPLSPAEFQELYSRSPTNVGQPHWYTVIGEEQIYGSMALYLYPYPDSAYNVDIIYQRYPRAISTYDYSDGTVSTTSGSSTVTGSGTSWTSRMEGAMLRLSTTSAKLPTNLDGAWPYTQEARIMSVVSATSIRLDTTATSTLSGVKYVISDPIDVQEGPMLNAYQRCAEKQLAQIARLQGWEKAVQAAQEAIMIARAADAREQTAKQMGHYRAGRLPLRNWPTGSDVSSS